MTRVVEVPASLDAHALDQLAHALPAWPPTDRLLVDARNTEWASPYGLVSLLTLGQAVVEAGGEPPLLTVPARDETRRYWARTGFFRHAGSFFELHGRVPRVAADESSPVLLEITAIRGTEDVHEVVGAIQPRAARILEGELKLKPQAAMGFAMALSEACQNIVEHAGTSGWVFVQAYTYRVRLGGRRVVVIAVSDAGIGFRRSLEASQQRRYGDRWGDRTALEAALIHSVSRFRDAGRGQGLKGITRYLQRWDGSISIRSGTARVAVAASWDHDTVSGDHLPFFPGAQLQITLAEQGPPAP